MAKLRIHFNATFDVPEDRLHPAEIEALGGIRGRRDSQWSIERVALLGAILARERASAFMHDYEIIPEVSRYDNVPEPPMEDIEKGFEGPSLSKKKDK